MWKLVSIRQLTAPLIGGLIWAACVATGMAALWTYQHRAGAPGDPPRQWPSHTSFSLSHDKATLLVFAHPRCPCTRATLTEINKVLARAENLIDAKMVFWAPPQFDAAWFETSLTRSTRDMGIAVHADVNGLEAEHFRVRTSGHALLYDRRGRLRYSGGITASRGHEGDNYGATKLLAAVNEASGELQRFPVFGCSLVGASQ